MRNCRTYYQVLDLHLEAGERVLQRDGDVRVEVVALPLELGVRVGPDLDEKIAGFAVEMWLALGHKLGLHSIGHSGLDLDFQKMLLGHKPGKRPDFDAAKVSWERFMQLR